MLALTASVTLASLVVQTWLGRERGPIGLGSYNATSLFVMVIATVAYFGMPVALSQRIASEEERGGDARRSTAVAVAISLGLGAATIPVSLLLWDPFVRLTGLPAAASDVMVASATLSAIIHSCAVNVLIARLRLAEVTVLVLVQPLAVAAGLALGLAGTAASASTLAAVGFIVAGIAAAVRLAVARAWPKLIRSEARAILRLALPATSVLHIQLLAHWIDRGIVALVSGPIGLGGFVAASFLTEAALRAPRSLGTFGVPAYARLADDAIGASRVLGSHVRLVSSFFIVTGAGFIAASAGLILAIFGDDFYSSATALRLLSVSLVPTGIALALASGSVGIAGPAPLRLVLLLFFAQIASCFILTAALGIEGAALSAIIVWSLAALVYLGRARRSIAGDVWRSLPRIVGVAFPIWVVSWRLGVPPVPWQIGTVVAPLIALAAVWAFILTDPDHRLIARLVPAWGLLRFPR